MRKSTAVLLALLAILIALPSFYSPIKGNAVGENWLSGWSYRKILAINGTSTSLSNYALRVTVYYGSGTDSVSGSNATVYLNGNSRTDFYDVRFTASDGSTLLHFWLDNAVNGSYAYFWVVVPSIPANSQVYIFIYYGNPSATRADDPQYVDVWSLRSHQSASGYTPQIYFSASNSILNITSTTSSIGEALAFIIMPKSFLDGKKVQINWTGLNGITVQGDVVTLAIIDGEVHRDNSYPSGSSIERNVFSNVLFLINNTGQFAWQVQTSNTISLSSFTSNYVTLVIDINDAWNGISFTVLVDWINILDSNNNVLISYDFNGTVVMATSGNEAYGVERYVANPEPSFILLTAPALSTPSMTTTAIIYMPAYVNFTINQAGVTAPPSISNFSISFPSGSITWVNGTGAASSGYLNISSVSFAAVNSTAQSVSVVYIPLPGFTAGTVNITVFTQGVFLSATSSITSVINSYSALLNFTSTRFNISQIPTYTITSNYTGKIALYNLNGYINLTPPSSILPGDVLVPHLYDWFFDGLSGYIVIGQQPNGQGTPFTVYGWSEITVDNYVNLVYPKTNTYWSKFSMIGDTWTDYPSIGYGAENKYYYSQYLMSFKTRTVTGGYSDYIIYLSLSKGYQVNQWTDLVTRFTVNREVSHWVNVTKVYSATVPTTEYTVLEWNPATATNPYMYKRFVLGASVTGGEYMTLYQSYLLIFSRALADNEIQTNYNSKIINATGLQIFMDATFWNGTNYFNLGINNATIGSYGNVSRLPANNTWLYLVRGQYSDSLVRFRFFPNGTIIVFKDGTALTVTGPVNSAGLIENFAVGRTDIAYILVPNPSSWNTTTLTSNTPGSLNYVVWMDSPAIYPFTIGSVVFDALKISSYSASISNLSRVSANSNVPVTLCVSLAHSYDNSPVTGGSVYVAGLPASYNGSCWVVNITSPNAVTTSYYSYLTSAVSQLNIAFNSTFSGTPPVLGVKWDGLNVSFQSIDYINKLANVSVVYGTDGAPVPSGLVSLIVGGVNLTSSISSGKSTIPLSFVNNTSPPVVYGLTDNAGVTFPAMNATIPYYNLNTSLIELKSSNPVSLKYIMFRGNTTFIRVNATSLLYIYTPYFSGPPVQVFDNGYLIPFTYTSNNIILQNFSSDVLVVYNATTVSPSFSLTIAPGGGTVIVGFTSAYPSNPLSGLYMALIINSTGVYGVIANGSLVLASNAFKSMGFPATVTLDYYIDYVSSTLYFNFLIASSTASGTLWQSNYVKYTFPQNTTFPAFYSFVMNPQSSGVYIERFAAVYGLGLNLISQGSIKMNIVGPFSVGTLIQYIVLDRPTTIAFQNGSLSVYYSPPGSAPLTLIGFSGFSISLGIGSLSISNVNIPTDSYQINVPLGYTIFMVIDPTLRTISMISSSPVNPPVTFTQTQTVPLFPVQNVSNLNGTSLLSGTFSDMFIVSTLAAIGIGGFSLTRKLSVGLGLAGAVGAFLGTSMQNIGLISAGLIALTVALIIRWSIETG